jgi:serine/threonine-protein kinase
MAAHAAREWEPMDLPSGTRVGDWCILGRLGWGGYGVVYLVRAERWPRRQAALKLALRPGAVSRRLEREVELLSRVKHPNVARFIEAGHWLVPGTRERLPFLVMEYVPGLSLYDCLSLRDVQVREALELFRQSALALHAVHSAGAMHRDVKGENLLVRDDGRLVLVDLGVGDYEGAPTLTGTQLPPGSPPYRSPEALRFHREHLDDFEAHYDFLLTDEVYALGVTWYRAFTRAFPFEAEGIEDSYQARLEGRSPRAPAGLNPRVPQEVSDLVLRLLAPRPEERPASAREVAEAVEALLRRKGPELVAHLLVRNEGATPHSRTTRSHTPPPPHRQRNSLLNVLGALARWWQWGRASALLLVALLVGALAAGSATCSRLARPVEDGRVGLSSEANHPTQEGPPMHESKTPATASQAPEAKLSAEDMDFMRALAAAVCLVSAGCASVPVKPSWPRDCPQEALAAMSIRGFRPGDQGHLTLDINRPTNLEQFEDFRAGPIVSFIDRYDSAVELLPAGTKLYGHMWTGGEKVHVYWTRAELPGGTQMPICIVLGFNEQGGYWKEPGTQPGTFKISQQVPVTVTRRFERPE